MVARLEQLNEAEKALDLARRNLVAWASHDLRTPLTSLRAMLDALADDVVTEPETVRRYLRQSQHELSHMSNLIDDLFELAQLDAGHLEMMFETSSLSDLISDTLEGFRVRAQSKGVQLSGEVSPSVDPLWMATDKISRVLNNLVENAIRHTPEGGEVRLGAEVENGSVLVTVADTGEGITPEDQPYIFDRFYRGEKSRSRKGQAGEGSGLGLAIAKGLVEAHGGEIWVTADAVDGTVMCFRLPHRREPVSPVDNEEHGMDK
jgi:signal transduction histidine kinase